MILHFLKVSSYSEITLNNTHYNITGRGNNQQDNQPSYNTTAVCSMLAVCWKFFLRIVIYFIMISRKFVCLFVESGDETQNNPAAAAIYEGVPWQDIVKPVVIILTQEEHRSSSMCLEREGRVR